MGPQHLRELVRGLPLLPGAGVHRPVPGVRLTLPQRGVVGEQLLSELSEARECRQADSLGHLVLQVTDREASQTEGVATNKPDRIFAYLN